MKEKKIFLFDRFGYRKERKEENVNILSFFCLVCTKKKKEKCILVPLCPY